FPRPKAGLPDKETTDKAAAENTAEASDSAPLVRTPTGNMRVEPTKLKEDKATVNLPGSIGQVCVGGNGRFVIVHLPEKRQLDIQTLKEVSPAATQNSGPFMGYLGYPPALGISADGRVIGMWTPGLSPSGFHTVTLIGRTFKANSEHTTVGHILPSADGHYLL